MRKWLIESRGNETQSAIAKKLGIDRSTVAKAEQGGGVSVALAMKWAALIGVDWTLFFEEKGKLKSPKRKRKATPAA